MVKNQAKSITKNSVTRHIVRIIAKFLVATFFATYFLNGDSPNGLPFLSNMSICQRSFDASFQCRICTIFSPSSMSGTTIVMLVFFSSLSFASHSHYAHHSRASIPFGACSFSDLACINLLVYFMPPCLFFYTSLCLFYIPCVFFYPKPLSKKTQPLFLLPNFPCRFVAFIFP